MVGSCERVHEALVGGYDASAQALRQDEIHQVVDRPVERNGEPHRICGECLIGVPPNRHIRHGSDELWGRTPINLTEPDLSPDCIGDFGSEKARGMEFLPSVDKIAGAS